MTLRLIIEMWEGIMQKKHRTPELGSIRRRTKFLFKPMTVSNETRWLERSTWKEKWSGREWKPIAWVDKKGWGK